jgi:hypothetical protein
MYHNYLEIFKNKLCDQAWWYMPIIPAFRRQRQMDGKFQVNLGYLARFCLKKTIKKDCWYPFAEILIQ